MTRGTDVCHRHANYKYDVSACKACKSDRRTKPEIVGGGAALAGCDSLDAPSLQPPGRGQAGATWGEWTLNGSGHRLAPSGRCHLDPEPKPSPSDLQHLLAHSFGGVMERGGSGVAAAIWDSAWSGWEDMSSQQRGETGIVRRD